MAKKMYVVQSVEHGAYWCGLNHWDDQLRKAQIFHSLKCVDDVYRKFKDMKLKTVEIYMGIVPEHPTNADRIRAMTDKELGEFLGDWAQSLAIWRQDSNGEVLYWLQQPCEEGTV